MGYLHVPDMMALGWAQLHRDVHTEMSRAAVLLNVRSNGGGHTSQLVLEKLARELTGWMVPHGKLAHTYPKDVRRGPLTARPPRHRPCRPGTDQCCVRPSPRYEPSP
ncbi:MAG: hypothetical protein LC749_08760 [Actinobacteria bacterium]|nr:hypothetical protein [Actinomycetota bacterium]